jgi:hypothetical protein
LPRSEGGGCATIPEPESPAGGVVTPAVHGPGASHGVMVAAHRLGHANASVTTRHYARPVDGRDADVAKHLDKLGKPKRSGTSRARKPRDTSS